MFPKKHSNSEQGDPWEQSGQLPWGTEMPCGEGAPTCAQGQFQTERCFSNSTVHTVTWGSWVTVHSDSVCLGGPKTVSKQLPAAVEGVDLWTTF